MDVMTSVLISLASVVIGAILSTIWSKRPFLPFESKVTTSYIGEIKELDLAQISPHGHNEEYKYSLISFEITKGKYEVTIDIVYECWPNRKPFNKKIGRIKGKGKLADGIAYIVYDGKNDVSNEKWAGCAVMRIDRFGPLNGHWLSAHHDGQKRGPFAIGQIDVRAKRET